MITASIGTHASRSHHEPSATGVASSSNIAPAYIGWRTRPYGPVSITRCSAATPIVAAVKVLTLNTTKTIQNPTTTTTSARIDKGQGTFDHPKRWSTDGTTSRAMNASPATDWIRR